MAKQKVTNAIQQQFNKIQYKPGDAVFFTWLGMKKYGYVIRTKETNWGVQYTIDSEGTKYPCGIQIKTHKTSYTTGCINHDETRALGQQELVTRIQPDTQAHIQKFLETPEGQIMKAEATLQLANGYLHRIVTELNQPELDLRQKMLLNLALMECMETIQKNEEILNLMMPSKNNETF